MDSEAIVRILNLDLGRSTDHWYSIKIFITLMKVDCDPTAFYFVDVCVGFNWFTGYGLSIAGNYYYIIL